MKRKCAISSTGSSGSSVRRGENSLPNYRRQRTRQGAPLMQTLGRVRCKDPNGAQAMIVTAKPPDPSGLLKS